MKKIFKSKLIIQVVVASMVATLATAGMVAAATTIGTNINTGGTVTATGATTIYGATSVGGALTATSTLAVTGVTTLTGNLILSTASSTGLVKVDSLQLGAVAITPTGTELNYVDGVTSAIQTQLDLKSPLASPTFTGTAIFAAASSTGLVKVDSLQLGTVAITPTGTELNYVDGVTSAIQTQLDAKQASDADLTTYAGITPSLNVQSLLGSADYAAMRTNLSLVPGTNVQAYDATLLSIAGLGTAANKIAYTTGVDTWAEAAITAAGLAILDDDNAAAQLTTLGAAPLANPIFTGNVKKSVQAGVVANLLVQATATQITGDLVDVATCDAGVNDSVKLPTAVAGMQIMVTNHGVGILNLFPASGGNINEAGLNLVKTVAVNASVLCYAYDAVNWECLTMAR